MRSTGQKAMTHPKCSVTVLVALLIFSTTTAFGYSPEALADEVVNLPGAPPVNFKQFSGYLSAPGKTPTSKQIHYWFVESLSEPLSKPIALWTNGGPGCSGLIGALTEMGPFRPQADGSLILNDAAWNSVSNMFFIESPIGVGFSYSDYAEDYDANDASTAELNYNIIQAFLARFPEYRPNPFFLASESYGGHYLPTLAQFILHQQSVSSDPKINFKGFAVGNPYTDVYSGSPAMLDTMWGHQLIPYPLWSQFVSAGCQNDSLSNAAAIKCFALENELYNAMGELNPYALDYDICVSSSEKETKQKRSSRAQRLWLLHAQLASRGAEAEVQEKDHRALVEAAKMKESYQPCADDYATSWANFPDVKTALHVKTNINWEECSSTTRYNYSDSAISMVSIYKDVLIPSNISILVFSGDDDSICATIGTQSWIWSMGFQPLNMWQPWYDDATKEPFGFLTHFSGTRFSFLTVHKAGHEVPMTQPKAGLQLWEQFITGKLTG